MAETYVARGPIKYGDPDGNVFLLQQGDELPDSVNRTQQLDLLAAGAVVPKKVWEALKAADEAQKEAEKVQADAVAEAARAQGAAVEAQGTALLEAHAALLEAAPEAQPLVGANVPSTTPTVQEVQIAKAQQPKLATPTPKAETKTETKK